MDLYAERHEVRQSGQAQYLHREDVQFAGEHLAILRRAGHAVQAGASGPQACPPKPDFRTPPQFPRPIGSAPLPMQQAPPPPPVRKGARTGMTVEHPKYGTGTVVRREGEGEDAKITVNFPRYGLKKLVEKYAGLKRN